MNTYTKELTLLITSTLAVVAAKPIARIAAASDLAFSAAATLTKRQSMLSYLTVVIANVLVTAESRISSYRAYAPQQQSSSSASRCFHHVQDGCHEISTDSLERHCDGCL